MEGCLQSSSEKPESRHREHCRAWASIAKRLRELATRSVWTGGSAHCGSRVTIKYGWYTRQLGGRETVRVQRICATRANRRAEIRRGWYGGLTVGRCSGRRWIIGSTWASLRRRRSDALVDGHQERYMAPAGVAPVNGTLSTGRGWMVRQRAAEACRGNCRDQGWYDGLWAKLKGRSCGWCS